jgi:hypothetical protein
MIVPGFRVGLLACVVLITLPGAVLAKGNGMRKFDAHDEPWDEVPVLNRDKARSAAAQQPGCPKDQKTCPASTKH